LLKDGSTGLNVHVCYLFVFENLHHVFRQPRIYFKVLREGQVRIGDKAENVRKDENNVTIKDIVHLYILLEITQ
jgi:MOSC domain-containing protein YiiM